jgi:Ca2+-binding EF-hand superfamily protein
VTVPDNKIQFFVDLQSHLLAGIRIPQALDVVYSDYQTVDGIRLAMTRELILKEPKSTIVYQFEAARLNVDVDDDLFQKSGNRKKSSPHATESQTASFTGKQMIQFLDRDGDQRISIEEATDELRSDFQFVDKNGDGFIDLLEANTIAAYAARRSDKSAMANTQRVKATSKDGSLNGILARLDRDRDGSIAWEEAPEDLKLFFDDYDQNGDGKITRTEAQAIADYLARNAVSTAPMREPGRGKITAAQLVEQMDADGDGVIGMDEAPNELKVGFSSVDVNCDEVIDRNEAQAIADYLNRQQGE